MYRLSSFFSGKAYPPEFYYDTYSPLWQNRPRVYGFKLQWTQMNPNAVDRIVAYRLGIRQVPGLRLIRLLPADLCFYFLFDLLVQQISSRHTEGSISGAFIASAVSPEMFAPSRVMLSHWCWSDSFPQFFDELEAIGATRL